MIALHEYHEIAQTTCHDSYSLVKNQQTCVTSKCSPIGKMKAYLVKQHRIAAK